MAALIDSAPISSTQRVELYEEGIIWIIDDSEHKEIKLDAAASTQLFDFLLLHQERLKLIRIPSVGSGLKRIQIGVRISS